MLLLCDIACGRVASLTITTMRRKEGKQQENKIVFVESTPFGVCLLLLCNSETSDLLM